jgi:two-component system, cell cycle response regulator DivK
MKSILIVEDNDKNMKLLRDILRHQGYLTLEAQTGRDAVRLAIEHRPDLVLMDIRLPDIDGIRALQLLREQPTLDATRVLAVSASAMPEEQAKVVESGFDGFIPKPISVRHFLETVERVLAVREDPP